MLRKEQANAAPATAKINEEGDGANTGMDLHIADDDGAGPSQPPQNVRATSHAAPQRKSKRTIRPTAKVQQNTAAKRAAKEGPLSSEEQAILIKEADKLQTINPPATEEQLQDMKERLEKEMELMKSNRRRLHGDVQQQYKDLVWALDRLTAFMTFVQGQQQGQQQRPPPNPAGGAAQQPPQPASAEDPA